MSMFIVSENLLKKVTKKQIPDNYQDAVYHVSDGNKKYVATPECAFLIWSLPAVVTCPNRTALCEKFCYAIKAEKAYPEVMPARRDNLKASLSDNFVRDMILIIRRRAKYMRKPKLVIRIHESGDFYNRNYMRKWLEIARACADDARIEFWTYTKSFSFFDGVDVPENFHLIASVWDDTKESDLETIARNGWKTYSAVPKFTKEPEENRCRCENCGKCGKCGNESIRWLKVEIH